MQIKTRDFDFDVKEVAEDGHFSGYGSVFGVVDSQREIVAPGAFAESLARRTASGRKLPILWQHRAASPIGVYEKAAEDARGLYLEGRLLIKDVILAREAHALLKAGAVTGQSIGYRVLGDTFDSKTRVRTLTKLQLEETSLVTFPANDEARVSAVKSALDRNDLPTLSEFEDFLREAGFSKSQACAIASKGLRDLLTRSESGGDIKSLLEGFTLPTFSKG